MATIEPVPPHPAAVIEAETRLLAIADYHAGFEAALRYEEGVELRSRAPDRRDLIHQLVAENDPDRLLVLGDMTHSIGEPGGAERGELEVLFDELPIPVTIAKGNHDGILEDVLATDPGLFGNVRLTDAAGARLGDVGVVHGHTWPSPRVLSGTFLCVGHEHPCVRLADEVGGARIERVWIRGQLDPAPFETFHDTEIDARPEIVVFPAFNDLCGGTWVNVPEQEFLAPFLPDALIDGIVYLLDGTRLGALGAIES